VPRRDLKHEIGHVYPKLWTVGVDLGQAQDPSAVVIIETQLTKLCYYDGYTGALRQRLEGEEHRVRHAERLPLQMPYPEQVAYVGALLRSPELPARDTELVVDLTGVGRPVFELFEVSRPVGIVITGGTEAVRHGAMVWHVPKILLISRLQASLHAGELKFAAGLTEAQAFKQELSEFRMRYTESGRLTFGAREGRHDDLVLALCVALWRAVARSGGLGVQQQALLGL
jgi:hypothetical protein